MKLTRLALTLCLLLAPAGLSAQQRVFDARDMYDACADFAGGAPMSDANGTTEAAVCWNAILNVLGWEGADSSAPAPQRFCLPPDIRERSDLAQIMARAYLAWFDQYGDRTDGVIRMADLDGLSILSLAASMTWPCPQ